MSADYGIPGSAELDILARSFWDWRAREQPRTDDDIPRIERPAGWLPDWTPKAVSGYRAAVADFERRWQTLPLPSPESDDLDVRAYVVDHALLGSAIARARFELDTTRSWQTDPTFYVDQSIGVVFDLLRPRGEFDISRTLGVIAALEGVPGALEQGRENLEGSALTEPTRLAIAVLDSAGGRPQGAPEAVADAIAALSPLVPRSLQMRLQDAGASAAEALADFRDWLDAAETAPWTSIGRGAFDRFLREVALNPATPDELLHTGLLELHRAEAFSVIESRGHRLTSGRSAPRDPLPDDLEAICARQHEQESWLRRFYEEHGILSQPASLRHYLLEPMPAYLEPLQWLGVTDDLAWEKAAEGDAVSWQPSSSAELGFFDDAIARDPMTGLIHEGCHSQQLALSAANPDWIRRHYYDSGANEGIGYYNEEMLDRAGLFEGNPNSHETIHAFLRLRTLRVQVDIRLALGQLTIPEAARLLAESVPMDEATANWEAAFFAKTPGQGMTYQVGKSQILAFLAEAARRPGFTLQSFHDRLWANGNVPIALQRYEVLGEADQLSRIRI